MRVLHVGLESTSTRPGGLNRYLEALVAAQRALGLDASAIVLSAPDVPLPDGVVSAGPPEASLPARLRAVDRAVRRAGPPDVADLHFAGTAALTATFGALRGVPSVVHFQGPWADESRHAGQGRANAALKARLERAVYRRADRVVVLSDAFGRVVARRYGVAPWSIETIPPGVDLDRFTPGDRAEARAALGVSPDADVCVTVRRLVPRMGVDVLLEAWARVASVRRVLAVVGDGPERRALEARAAELDLAATVRFCGRVTDAELVSWYRAADVAAVPSVALEGFGLVVLEAAACGCAVVGTDAEGLAEALAAVGGVVVPAGDAAALAAALGAALVEPSGPDVGARRRARVAHLGWPGVARRHEALYERVLGNERARRVVLVDHTAVLSGGELAIARAIGGLGAATQVHAVLAADGPLVGRLEAVGASVEVLALAERARALPRDRVRPVALAPLAVLDSAVYAARLASRFRALRPDVVHANSLKSALIGCTAARLARVPSVWHLRDQVASPYLPAFAVRLVRRAARVLPDVVVANSASTLATVDPRVGVVVPSPLDPSVLGVVRVPQTDELRLTVLGRLAPWKGQDLALRAFALAFPSGGAHLSIAGAALFGEDTYAASLTALAAELGIEARVSFCGFVDDVAALLARTDVLVHASTLPEPFGQVVLEAMGAGCAVVVADAGGPAEVVTDGRDGLRYRAGDVGALAATLQEVAGDAALRERLGAAAIETARGYLPEALAPALTAAWDAAVATRRRPDRYGVRRG